jgi:type III secretion protein J
MRCQTAVEAAGVSWLSSVSRARGQARAERIRGRLTLAIGLLGLCHGCAIPVANDLDEVAANKVVAALGRNGVAADKKRDPENEDRFSVDVGRGDASFALSVMAREELPPHSTPGLSETLGQGSFIPSRADERAKFLVGTAGELQHSLLSIDNVIAARVHLAIPQTDALDSDRAGEAPSASVLLKHGGTVPPLSQEEIQRLVAGAVPGLDPASVTVVTKAVADAVERTGTELVRLGPLTTTRSSLPYLRWMIACVATLNVCMVALLFALWLRARRSEGRSSIRGPDATG